MKFAVSRFAIHLSAWSGKGYAGRQFCGKGYVEQKEGATGTAGQNRSAGGYRIYELDH
jgi:hypothetical protein